MSAPQCPATVLVARPAAATYDEPVGDGGGWLTDVGRGQAEQLAETVRRRRVARIYASDDGAARETAAIVARTLGIESVDLPEIGERPVDHNSSRHPGGEGDHEMVLRVRAALETVADLHRGETVLVVSDGAAMALAIPASGPAEHPAVDTARRVPPGAVTEVAIGADGWHLLSWPGMTERTA